VPPSPSTEAEVIAIRDNAECIAMPASVAAEVKSKRGDPDIVAESAWIEWPAALKWYPLARRNATYENDKQYIAGALPRIRAVLTDRQQRSAELAATQWQPAPMACHPRSLFGWQLWACGRHIRPTFLMNPSARS
jgi:hypothetical protein